MKSLDKKELKELLVKCWMTHDGLWFYHSLQENGIEKTNRANQAAAKSIGMIEAKRILKAFGIEKIATLEELKKFMEEGFEVVRGDFMNFTFDWTAEGALHVTTSRCFAHDGIKKMGAIDGYDCGIFARVGGWFDGLEIQYKIDPPLEGCMLYKDGACYRDFTFHFL